jgi:GTP-dependent phosphoenolpyruvate carboxykinase
VSVDDSTDRDARTRALQFLKEQKATFTNLLLTEDPKLWQEKWQIPGPPCLFLFDAEGRLIQKWAGGEIVAATVEARVKELLKGD